LESEDCSALTIQDKIAGGRGHESDFEGRGHGGGRLRGREGDAIYCHYCKELGYTKYNCLLL